MKVCTSMNHPSLSVLWQRESAGLCNVEEGRIVWVVSGRKSHTINGLKRDPVPLCVCVWRESV